jgi:hypothetical protein
VDNTWLIEIGLVVGRMMDVATRVAQALVALFPASACQALVRFFLASSVNKRNRTFIVFIILASCETFET